MHVQLPASELMLTSRNSAAACLGRQNCCRPVTWKPAWISSSMSPARPSLTACGSTTPSVVPQPLQQLTTCAADWPQLPPLLLAAPPLLLLLPYVTPVLTDAPAVLLPLLPKKKASSLAALSTLPEPYAALRMVSLPNRALMLSGACWRALSGFSGPGVQYRASPVRQTPCVVAQWLAPQPEPQEHMQPSCAVA